jgi:hypothetical protein
MRRKTTRESLGREIQNQTYQKCKPWADQIQTVKQMFKMLKLVKEHNAEIHVDL